jgi:hypothetical protein
VAIQAFGYLLLLAAVYGWLGIADGSVWQVALSAVLALAIVSFAVWLIADALAAPVGRSLPWLLAAAALVAGCVWLAGRVKSVYATPLWIAGTVAVLVLLPLAGGAASALRRPSYWAIAFLLALAGLALPWLLVIWVPRFQSFGAQTASLVVRFALAYAIALASWLLLARLPQRLRPRGQA